MRLKYKAMRRRSIDNIKHTMLKQKREQKKVMRKMHSPRIISLHRLQVRLKLKHVCGETGQHVHVELPDSDTVRNSERK